MKRFRGAEFVLAVSFLISTPSALASQYLDPGAASIVVQVVIAGVVGFLTILKLYWGKIKGLVLRTPQQATKEEVD